MPASAGSGKSTTINLRQKPLKAERTRNYWNGASKAERPNQEQILVWNSFIIQRGWRDDGAPGLIVEKELNGFANRDDIQTYVDLHDADEGRTPKHASPGRSC